MQRKIAVVGKEVDRAVRIIAFFASLGWGVEYSETPSKSDVAWVMSGGKVIPEARVLIYDEVDGIAVESLVHYTLVSRADIYIKDDIATIVPRDEGRTSLDAAVKKELIEDVVRILRMVGK